MRSLKRILPALLLLACALLFPPAEARADGVAITSGYFAAYAPSVGGRFRTFVYDFGGNGLRIQGSEPDGIGQSVGWNCVPAPCGAGSNFNISHRAGLFTWVPGTTLQFNGQTFTGRGQGPLDFVTGEMTWPPAGESVITLTTHFTLTGSVSFDALNFSNNTWTSFFVTNVYGSGIADITLTWAFDRYHVSGVSYRFQQPTETPEPATLVLLGSGLAGLALRRRRARRRGKQVEIHPEGREAVGRMTKILPALLLLSCALFYPAVEAHADPIVITSGVFVVSNPTPVGREYRSWGYDLHGDGFRITGGEPDGSSQNVMGCSPCTPGETFHIYHPANVFARIPTQSIQFNGETHLGWAGGLLNFTTDTFTTPNFADGVLTLTGHFTMTGSITFDPYIYVNPVDVPPFVVGDVYGSGIVTIQFAQYLGRYYLSVVRYEFQQPAAQTPEPLTLVLLGSGLAGLAAHRRRRRRAGSPR